MYSISSLLNSIILVEVLTCIGNRFQSLMTLGTKHVQVRPAHLLE